MDLTELFLGQIPEAIYFALFMIFTKELKSKRVLYIVLMVIDYLLLKSFIVYSIWFQVLYTIVQYLILKVLYKEKAQITDIFTFGIASLILMISCIIPSFIMLNNSDNYVIYAILTRMIMFGFLFLFKNKLYKIQEIYKKIWNRNDATKKKIKSTTFRCLNLVVFNGMFYLINLGLIYAVYYNSFIK